MAGEAQKTYVRGDDGSVYTVDQKDVAQAVEAGAEQITPEEGKAAELQAKYGDVGHALEAGAIGAADALTLGTGKGIAVDLSRALNPEQGQALAEHLQGVEEANPVASGVGTVAGALAPALFTGGESLLGEGSELGSALGGAGRFLGAPTESLAALGRGAEGLTSSLIGDSAEGLVGKALQRGISTGVGGAVEGGFYGAGSTWSEAQIENHELTAEQLLAGAAKGAAFGGLLGVGIGAGSSVLGDVGERLATRAANVDLEKEAGELAYRATGAKTQEIKRLKAVGSDPATVGRFIVDEIPKYSDKPLWRMNVEDIQAAAKEAAKEAGAKIDVAMDDLASIATQKGALPNVKTIVDRVNSEVIDPLRALPGYEGQVAKLEKYAQSFEAKSRTASFADLKKFREALDDQIYRGNRVLSDDPIVKELRATRGILEDEIASQGGQVAGADWVERYKGGKKQYQLAKQVDEATAKGAARMQANRGISITDTIAAGAGLAHAGPLGLVAGLANKAFREHADQIGAFALDRIAKLQAMKSLAAKTNNALTSGIKGFLGAARDKVELAAIAAETEQPSFAKRSEHVKQMASNPDLMAQHIAHRAPPSDVAPNVSGLFSSKQAAALAYLNQQLPRGYMTQAPWQTQATVPPTRAEIAKWMTAYDVYEDPVKSVTSELSKGTLTSEHVHALASMYPAMYQDMQQKIMSELADMAADGKSPNYNKRIQIGTLFAVPADATLSPQFLQSQAAMYAAAPQPHPSAPTGSPKLPTGHVGQTESQKLESGNSS